MNLIEEAAKAYADGLTFDNPRLSSDQIYGMRQDAKKDFEAGAAWGLSAGDSNSIDPERVLNTVGVDIDSYSRRHREGIIKAMKKYAEACVVDAISSLNKKSQP